MNYRRLTRLSLRVIRTAVNIADKQDRPYEPVLASSSRAAVSVSPEVYVIVDSTLAEALGTDAKVKEYLGVFWNAVNKRFATMSDPKVNLVLSGAIIVRKSADEPYINENVLIQNYIHGHNTLYSTINWLNGKKGDLPKYVIDFLMTGKDLSNVESGSIKKDTTGLAFTSSACRYRNVAIGEDIGLCYMGVIPAAHEVAHTLGSPHDGVKGAEACSWWDGYIMSYVNGKSNSLFFSSCSQQLMKNFITSSRASCLHTTQVGEKIKQSSTLPGQIVSMDEQCQKFTGKETASASMYDSDDSLCEHLWCQYPVKEDDQTSIHFRHTGRPAAEGSSCRSGGYCINGSCKSI